MVTLPVLLFILCFMAWTWRTWLQGKLQLFLLLTFPCCGHYPPKSGLQLGSAESCHLFSCCFPSVAFSLATCCGPAVACGMGAVTHPGLASAAGSGARLSPSGRMWVLMAARACSRPLSPASSWSLAGGSSAWLKCFVRQASLHSCCQKGCRQVRLYCASHFLLKFSSLRRTWNFPSIKHCPQNK